MATSWSGPALKSRRPMRIARSAMFGGATFALTSSPMKAPAKWRFSAARSLSRPGRVDRKASFRSASMIGGATSSKHCARVAKTRAKNGSSSRRSFGQRRISSTSLFRAPFPLLLATQKAITKSSQSCALWSASKSTVSSRMSAANGPDFDSSASAPSLRRSSSMPPSSSMGSFPALFLAQPILLLQLLHIVFVQAQRIARHHAQDIRQVAVERSLFLVVIGSLRTVGIGAPLLLPEADAHAPLLLELFLLLLELRHVELKTVAEGVHGHVQLLVSHGKIAQRVCLVVPDFPVQGLVLEAPFLQDAEALVLLLQRRGRGFVRAHHPRTHAVHVLPAEHEGGRSTTRLVRPLCVRLFCILHRGRGSAQILDGLAKPYEGLGGVLSGIKDALSQLSRDHAEKMRPSNLFALHGSRQALCVFLAPSERRLRREDAGQIRTRPLGLGVARMPRRRGSFSAKGGHDSLHELHIRRDASEIQLQQQPQVRPPLLGLLSDRLLVHRRELLPPRRRRPRIRQHRLGELRQEPRSEVLVPPMELSAHRCSGRHVGRLERRVRERGHQLVHIAPEVERRRVPQQRVALVLLQRPHARHEARALLEVRLQRAAIGRVVAPGRGQKGRGVQAPRFSPLRLQFGGFCEQRPRGAVRVLVAHATGPEPYLVGSGLAARERYPPLLVIETNVYSWEEILKFQGAVQKVFDPSFADSVNSVHAWEMGDERWDEPLTAQWWVQDLGRPTTLDDMVWRGVESPSPFHGTTLWGIELQHCSYLAATTVVSEKTVDGHNGLDLRQLIAQLLRGAKTVQTRQLYPPLKHLKA
eukprot:scaffold57_cov254-Pinguiococcus_pyrenoidosus.AAC.30